MQRKSKPAVSKKPNIKVSAKKCFTKGVKANTGGMTAKKPAEPNAILRAIKNTAAKNKAPGVVFVRGHFRVINETGRKFFSKKPAKAAAKAKPAARSTKQKKK